MSNGEDYEKPCKNCKQTITMSMRSGKWGAYEKDNSYHKCIDKQEVQQQQQPHLDPQPIIEKHEEATERIETQVIEVKEKPGRVPRPTTAMFALIEHESAKEALRKLTEYVNKYRGYGGQTFGVTYHKDKESGYTQFFVSHDIPNLAVAEMEEI